jgi:hypothetical protein
MRTFSLVLGAVALAWLAACSPNPLAPVTGSDLQGPVSFGQAEIVGLGSDVLFSPTCHSGAACTSVRVLSPTNSPVINSSPGLVIFGQGGASKTFQGPSSPTANVDGYQMFGAQFSRPPLILGPLAWLCPSGSCAGTVKYRGAGGPTGDYSNDYFVRWRGFKGANASADYASMVMQFKSGGAAADISVYRGFTFWARGHGNFAVNIDGAQPDPYSGYNLYLKRFGAELNGDEQWKQIIVYFSEMVQEYGQAADKPNVLKKAAGLQFDQQSPYTSNFQLDVDYVRFFK